MRPRNPPVRPSWQGRACGASVRSVVFFSRRPSRRAPTRPALPAAGQAPTKPGVPPAPDSGVLRRLGRLRLPHLLREPATAPTARATGRSPRTCAFTPGPQPRSRSATAASSRRRRSTASWTAGSPLPGHGGPDMPIWGDAFRERRDRLRRREGEGEDPLGRRLPAHPAGAGEVADRGGRRPGSPRRGSAAGCYDRRGGVAFAHDSRCAAEGPGPGHPRALARRAGAPRARRGVHPRSRSSGRWPPGPPAG